MINLSSTLPIATAVFALLGCQGSFNPDSRGPLGKADIADGQCQSSAASYCGGQSEGACYCDSDCELFGDCCSDYVSSCESSGKPILLISEGLHAPESVDFHAGSGTYFVSNLAVNILEADPNAEPTDGVGFVSQYAQDGSLLNARFATGLNSPKGVAVIGDIVYVADPKAVVAYDVYSGAEVARYTAEDVGLLNDLAVDPKDSTIYVTDTANGTVLKLDVSYESSMEVVAKDPTFEFPNGLAVMGETLVMGSTGILPSAAGPGTPGFVYLIDKATGSTEKLEGSSGRWDGVVALPDGTIAANDFATGELFRIDQKTGAKTRILENHINPEAPFSGVADVNLSGTTLMMPSMFTNEVYLHSPSLANGSN